VKEYLDNVADFCSVYSLFILVLVLDYVILIRHFLFIREEGHARFPPSERAAVQARRWLTVFAIFLIVAAPIAAVAYYFGDGQTYMHYLQKYMDEVCPPVPLPPPSPPSTIFRCRSYTMHPPALPLQVADFITIVLAALCAALCASALHPRLPPAAVSCIQQISPNVLCGVQECLWFSDIVRLPCQRHRRPVLHPRHHQMGTRLPRLNQRVRVGQLPQLIFCNILRMYVDEVADLLSIALFSFFLAASRHINMLTANSFAIKDGKNLPYRVISFCQRPIIMFATIIAAAFFLSTQFVDEQTTVNFLKHNLDEVADVCSILTAAMVVYYEHRARIVAAALELEFGDGSKRD
jgi:hypothetical protein